MNIVKRMTQGTIQAEVSSQIQRATRMIDLDKPIVLNPCPLIQLQDSVVKLGLKKLFESMHFSICDFDKLCELARVYPPPRLRETLAPLHCVSWRDMEPDLRHDVQQHILACFIPVETQGEEQGDGES